MNKVSAVILTLLFGILAHAEVVSSPRIEVRAESRVSSQKIVHLEDIAVLSGFESDVLAQVKDIEVMDAPMSAAKKHFTNIGLAQILRAKLAGFDQANKIVLSIPNEISLTRKTAKLESADVETELINELKKQCAACEFEVTSLNLPIMTQDFSNGTTWKIKVGNQLPKGSFSIPLEVNSEDANKHLYWLSGTVTVRKLVPVAKRNINANENLKDDDFAFEKKEVTYVNDKVASVDDLKNAVAARGIFTNQIIEGSAIRKPSVVRSGETVKVFIGEDGWQVSMDGIAQQNAYKGDIVKVKIPRTQKIMSGIATEKGTVQVQ